MILVTGGAGFIGTNFVRDWLAAHDEPVINVDCLTYAGNLDNLSDFAENDRHSFYRVDIGHSAAVTAIFDEHRLRAIVNFAAESHVDRSIRDPEAFVRTNIVGTFRLVEAAQSYPRRLDDSGKADFRFLHVSTDEVYGSLEPDEAAFSEAHPCRPNSPYSATKAAADHLVRAYHHTFGLPTLTTNCYGPYQFPENLIPQTIQRALAGTTLPIYGDGRNVRDWLYIGDHCHAIRSVLDAGTPGETYNIGDNSEMTNLDVVDKICAILDRRTSRPDGRSYRDQIRFAPDRPGHDRRYAVDIRKIRHELDWSPRESFETGLTKTIA